MAALLGVRLSGSTRHENLNGIYLLEPDLRTNGCDVFSKPSVSSKQTSYIYRNDKECWMVAPQKAHMAKNVGCIASIDAGAASPTMEGMKWESFYEQFAYDPLMGSKNKEVGSASSKQNPFIADPAITCEPIKDGTAKMSLKDRKEAAEAAEAARQSREGEGGEEPITVFGGGAINRKASYTMGLNDDDSNRSPIRSGTPNGRRRSGTPRRKPSESSSMWEGVARSMTPTRRMRASKDSVRSGRDSRDSVGSPRGSSIDGNSVSRAIKGMARAVSPSRRHKSTEVEGPSDPKLVMQKLAQRYDMVGIKAVRKGDNWSETVADTKACDGAIYEMASKEGSEKCLVASEDALCLTAPIYDSSLEMKLAGGSRWKALDMLEYAKMTKRRAIVIIAKDAKALAAWTGSTGKESTYTAALAGGGDVQVYMYLVDDGVLTLL